MNERMVSCIRDRATVHFSQFEGAEKALRFFDARPQELVQRVEELDRVVLMMNGLLPVPLLIDRDFVNLNRLRDVISPNTGIPMLGEEVTQNLAEATFVDIEQEIVSGSLKLPPATDQPGRTASILLLQGYGLLLEKHFQKPGLRETFVLACEELIVTHLRGSRLFEDVFDWASGHKEKFSPKVQSALSTA